MFGLEHHSHPPLAKLVQHPVLAEGQPLDLSLVNHLGLIPGERVGFHQFAGQRLGVAGILLGRQTPIKRRNVGRRHQTALQQVLDELGQPGVADLLNHLRHRHRRGAFQLFAQFRIVGGLRPRIQQAGPGRGQLVEYLLRRFPGTSPSDRSGVRHPLGGRITDDVGVGFPEIDPQQPIITRRLLARCNPQPAMSKGRTRLPCGTRQSPPFSITAREEAESPDTATANARRGRPPAASTTLPAKDRPPPLAPPRGFAPARSSPQWQDPAGMLQKPGQRHQRPAHSVPACQLVQRRHRPFRPVGLLSGQQPPGSLA